MISLFNVVLLLFTASCLVTMFYLLKRTWFLMSLTYPTASGKLPLIGSAIEFGMDGLGFLSRQKERLKSNVFLVDLFILRFHFVLGPECTRQFYKASNQELDFLAGVPDILPELVEDAWDTDPTFQSKGHALVLKGFSQKDRLDHALTILTEELDKVIQRWLVMGQMEVFSETSRLTVLVTLRFILGDDIYHEQGEHIANLYDQLEKDLAHPLVMTLRPLPTLPYKRLIKNRNELLEIMRRAVDIKIKKNDSNDPSFLQMLINELGPDHWYQYGFLCLGIILATRTNTAGVLAWTLVHWCNDPILKEKVLKEVDEHVANPNEHPIKECQWMDACMKETIRSYSNFMQFRKVVKKGGFEVEPGKIIPEGELICISPAEEHHDPKYFEDPFKYKPERWLDQQYWAQRSKDMAYVQWGFLRHRCYGEKFAQQFDKVAWSRILSQLKISKVDLNQGVPVPLWGSGFGTSFPVDDQPYFIAVSKRE